jgi:hypothetical protein
VRRWTMEVTFEEARAHLGMETQRQWNDRATLLLDSGGSCSTVVQEAQLIFKPIEK